MDDRAAADIPPSPAEPTLACETFRLRPWCRDDAASLQRHANNADVSRWLRDRFPFPYSLDDAAAFLDGCAQPHRDWRLAIEVDGAAAGGVGIHPGEDIYSGQAEVGYWLGEAYWSRGIVTEALRCLVPRAMDDFRLYRAFAGVFAGNTASMRVLERAGFVLEAVLQASVIKRGELLDTVVYARVRRSLDEPA